MDITYWAITKLYLITKNESLTETRHNKVELTVMTDANRYNVFIEVPLT